MLIYIIKGFLAKISYFEAIFLVVCDPFKNELWATWTGLCIDLYRSRSLTAHSWKGCTPLKIWPLHNNSAHTCLGHLWQDNINRNNPICITSFKVAKASRGIMVFHCRHFQKSFVNFNTLNGSPTTTSCHSVGPTSWHFSVFD